MPVRWAVVGTGAISQRFVPDLRSMPGAEVVAVFGRSGSRAFAAEHGIAAAFDDYPALLADPVIDAVYLATPFGTHRRMARAALEAGKHVLVEKPMARTAAEVADLFALAAERGQFLMEAMWMKFNPGFRDVLRVIAEGLIGEPRSIRAGFGVPFPGDRAGSRWDPERGGSTLLDQGIYPVTLAHAVFGPPAAVHASGMVEPNGVDVAEHITLDYAGGGFAHLAASMVEFVEPSAAISGTHGWVGIPPMFWATTSYTLHAGSREALFGNPPRTELPQEGNGFVPMLRAAGEAIERGWVQHPEHNAATTIEVFRTLDAIRTQLTGNLRQPLAKPAAIKVQ
ncbi:Gfo/Idh/MocA family protein [Actinoplanes subtropicus]|uniref:Gfo/Idh/MocA family protein n=1 Tax=Actinoplanes subtropicus TaxID=543632 RepID=UPI00068E8389|nr:Gfo/Idh/MocA family oxidoreductase [Actinoplanes subtropicus]